MSEGSVAPDVVGADVVGADVVGADAVEEAPGVAGAMLLHHGTTRDFDPRRVRPLTHFGTLRAARMRVSDGMARDGDVEAGDVYAFAVTIANPAVVAGDGDGVSHRLDALVGMLRAAGHLDEGEAARARADRGGGALRAILAGRGHDGVRYDNGVEDAGSVSWIVLDGSQASWTGERTELTRDEAIEMGWL